MFWIRGRRLWGARRAKNGVTRADWTKGVTPIVHHTADAGPKANTIRAEVAFMRQVQAFHQGPSRGWSDIAYNYIIMPSGRVYEARGFGVVGAHAPGWNAKGCGICFAGTFTDKRPTDAAIQAYHLLGARLKKKGAVLAPAKAHGEVYPTSCPGARLRQMLGL